MGLKIIRLEDDQKLQDLVLSVHHATSITFSATPAAKIIENHLGKAYVQLEQQIVVSAPPGYDPTKPKPRKRTKKK